MWLITNHNSSGFTFESSGPCYHDPENDIRIYYEGYILPRYKFSQSTPLEQEIREMYLKHNKDLIKYFKGNFVLIITHKNTFQVFSDHFAIKKFFYYQNKGEFIISNELSSITTRFKVFPSQENIALYTLTYHFTAGKTLFGNVWHNTPAQVLEFKNDQLTQSNYWRPSQLIALNKNKHNISDIAEALGNAVESSLTHINKDRISLSLTGGADTRNLLAVFLNKNIKPRLYTYGNPESNDCVKASTIARGLGLEHIIHDVQMTSELFEEYARKIIRLGGGIASIHRAHRIIAVENEKPYADWMFLGTLGGEFVKGVSEDDYITPSVVYENWDNSNFSAKQLEGYFRIKKLNYEKEVSSALLEIIRQEPYMNGKRLHRKHDALSFITAHLHDAQDVNLYASAMKEVFTPFLDIDYLELLFSSQFSFDNKERVSNKYLKRLNNPVFASKFLDVLYKPLLHFRYSGEHIPAKVLANKYYAAILKAIQYKTRPSYPPNFPLGKWMENFVARNLPICNEYAILKESFDLEKLISDFKKQTHIPKESYWLKYTNPIMMRFIMEEFGYD